MNPNYIGLIRKQDDSDFSVEFPDFSGCVTAGATLDEARAMAEEALQFHIDGMVHDRLPIPAPSSLEAIAADPEHNEALPFLVQVRLAKGKAVRVNVTFDEHLLTTIDALAAAKGMSRSGLLAEAFRLLEAVEKAPGGPVTPAQGNRLHRPPRRRRRSQGVRGGG